MWLQNKHLEGKAFLIFLGKLQFLYQHLFLSVPKGGGNTGTTFDQKPMPQFDGLEFLILPFRVAGGWVEIAAMGCGSSLQGQGQPKGQGRGQPGKGKRGGRASVIEAEAGLACLEINAFSEKKQLGDEAMNFSRPFFFFFR